MRLSFLDLGPIRQHGVSNHEMMSEIFLMPLRHIAIAGTVSRKDAATTYSPRHILWETVPFPPPKR